jgi:hypothetical protein
MAEMASNPKDVLRRLMADNPNASESELRDAFMRLVRTDEAFRKAVQKEVLDELGPDGIMNLLKPKNEKH